MVIIADQNLMAYLYNRCQTYRIWSFVLRCIFNTLTLFCDNQNLFLLNDNFLVSDLNLFTPSFELLTLITTGHNVNAEDEKELLSIFTSLETFSTLTSQTCLCIYFKRCPVRASTKKSHEEEFLIRMDIT